MRSEADISTKQINLSEFTLKISFVTNTRYNQKLLRIFMLCMSGVLRTDVCAAGAGHNFYQYVLQVSSLDYRQHLSYMFLCICKKQFSCVAIDSLKTECGAATNDYFHYRLIC